MISNMYEHCIWVVHVPIENHIAVSVVQILQLFDFMSNSYSADIIHLEGICYDEL